MTRFHILRLHWRKSNGQRLSFGVPAHTRLKTSAVSHLRWKQAEIISKGRRLSDFRPDRVAMQDATAQMALLQFMNGEKPWRCRLDRPIQDTMPKQRRILATATETNREVWFSRDVSSRFGIVPKPGGELFIRWCWRTMLFRRHGGRTDSHTPNAGGLGHGCHRRVVPMRLMWWPAWVGTQNAEAHWRKLTGTLNG